MLRQILHFSCKNQYYKKKINFQNFIRFLYNDTFQNRILTYFEDNLMCDKLTIRKNENKKLSSMNEIQINSISVISSLKNQNVNKIDIPSSVQEKLKKIYHKIENLSHTNLLLQNTMDELENECSQMFLLQLYNSEILCLLNKLLKAVPLRFVNSKIYKQSIYVLSDRALKNALTLKEMVQLIYYISLKKENESKSLKLLSPVMPNFKNLNIFEVSILAQSYYQCSLKLFPDQVEYLENLIETNCERLVDDGYLLVQFCKAIRLSTPSDKISLKNLSNTIANHKTPFQLTFAAHVLSLYAEAYLLEPEAINRLVQDSIDYIKNNKNDKNNLRIKDIDRLLYCISKLGMTLNLHEKLELRYIVENRLDEYKSSQNIGLLVNSLLCLNMLRCWSTKAILYCFQNNLFEQIFKKNFHWKVKGRLQLLLSQINLEMRMKIPHSLNKTVHIDYTPSDNVNNLYYLIHKLLIENKINEITIECPIKGLNLPGITIKNEKETFHIDILDNSTCFKNTKLPHGMLNFKLRLLSRLRYRQILIDGDNLSNDLKTNDLVFNQITNYLNYGKAASLYCT